MADSDFPNVLSGVEGEPNAIEANTEDKKINEEIIDPSLHKTSKKKQPSSQEVVQSDSDSSMQVLHAPEVPLLAFNEHNSQSTLDIEADFETMESQQQFKQEAMLSILSGDNDVNGRPFTDTQTSQDHTDIQNGVEKLFLSQTTFKSIDDAKRRKYHFWDTQPVSKFDEHITVSEKIETPKHPSEIQREPLALPVEFEWDTLDINDPLILKELYTLLNENYVEDNDNVFRFDYSPEFLQWALQPPGWLKNWHCGVRVITSKNLIGFISAIPIHIKIYDSSKKMVEINFLCVHKKLRAKRIAPLLIQEITRRVHELGLFQAVYTAGVVLPKPVTTCRYWHRSLNPSKLIEVKFSTLSRKMTMEQTLELYKLPEQPRTPGFRELTLSDVPEANKLLSKFLQGYDLAPLFTEEDFSHWFIPRPNIVSSFVVETSGKLTDFVSFYSIPSTVIHHSVHKSMSAAYSFYNASTRTPWEDLIQDALIVAKQLGFDVFNALDLMENKKFLETLKFGEGDGFLQYYLYNWKCPRMKTNQIGLVLQ